MRFARAPAHTVVPRPGGMGKRYVGGGGRRPVLDLGAGAVLNASTATESSAAPPSSDPAAETGRAAPTTQAPAAEPSSSVAASSSNPLLGLISSYGEEEDEDEVATAPGTEGLPNASAAPPPSAGTSALAASEWQTILDPASQAYYFWNTVTNEVRWEWPEPSTAASAASAASEAASASSEPPEAAPARADAALTEPAAPPRRTVTLAAG